MGEKGPAKAGFVYVRAASIEDLCRYVSRFDFTSDNLFASELEGKKVVMAIGEAFENKVICYYVPYEKKMELLEYRVPQVHGEHESAVAVEKMERQPSHYVNVVDIGLKDIIKKKFGKEEVTLLRAAGSEDIVRSLVKRSMRDEYIAHIYAFAHRGFRVIGAFDIVEELQNGRKAFYYSVSTNNVEAAFARYSYSDNSVDFSKTFGEHNYMYVKIINLAEPFPFFNDVPA
jgi:hypothetical protein